MSAALAFPRRRQRLGIIAEHIVVSAAAATATTMPTDDSAPVAIGQNEVEAARDEYKEGLKGRPRVELDVAAWSATELIQRGLALGASAAAIDACVDSTDSVARLVKLVRSLEPPPPQSVTADDLTVPNTTPVAELVERLNTYGAVIIENAADGATIAEVEGALAAVEAFDQPQEGGMLGRMWMDSLVKAPAVAKLVTHPLVLETGKQLLGPLCKRIALKELSVFEVKPGKGRQNFHREDQFWPWHHAPHAWSLNMLWAIDDFTDANGATRIIPFSPTGKLRESGREMVETAYDESEVLQAKMPRGSVLLFTGGMVHAAGENTTSRARRCVLSGYQLGWLRTEQKFWAYKPLHEALSAGEFHNQELAELLGHYDERKIENWVGTDWSGSRFESGYLSRTQDQAESDGDALYLAEQRGYEGNGRG